MNDLNSNRQQYNDDFTSPRKQDGASKLDLDNDVKFQFKTNDVNMAKNYTEQTTSFKRKLKRMQKAKDMGFRFAKLFQAAANNNKTFGKNCYLNPDKLFRRSWDTLMALVILWSTLITPIRVSIFYDKEVLWMDILGRVVDVIFMVDFSLNFFTAYYDKDVLITNKKAIAKRYAKNTMVLDFLTSMPLNLLLPTGKYDTNSFSLFQFLTRYPRFLQWIRLTKLLRFYRVMSDIDTFVEIIILRRVISRTTKKFIETGVVVLLLFHTLACLWYIVGIFNLSVHDNWVMRLGYLDRSKLEVYMACFHWTVQTIFTVGYGDFPARTKAEQLYSIFLQSIGQFIYAYIIGSISSIFNSMKKSNKAHDDTHVYIDNLLENGKIKKSTYSKVKRQLNQDEKSIMEKVEAICENLRPHSTRKFRLHIYRNIYNHIKILKNCTDEFLLSIGANLITANYYDGEYIYSPEDRVRSIYFLSEGKVSLFSAADKEKEVLTINEGEVFGDIEFFFNFDFRIVYARPSKKDCKVFILDYHVADDIFTRFDDYEAEHFKNDAKAKYEKIMLKCTPQERNLLKQAKMNSRLDANGGDNDAMRFSPEGKEKLNGRPGMIASEHGITVKKNLKNKQTQTVNLDSKEISELYNIKKRYMKLVTEKK